MRSALIGHTGFVGGNLTRQRAFDACYNSANIERIAGESFDLVVCSGAPAAKWIANGDPEGDRRGLDRLWENLDRASAAKVVLISSIDVYARRVEVDEDDDVGRDRASHYGRHRHDLERRCLDRFDALVVRLPGLFGEGLKKNAIYDFLHDNDVHKIDHRASYQFYGLDRLWADIEAAMAHGLRLLNVATEPVSIGEVARDAFGFDFDNERPGEPARYDFRSKHAGLFGGSGGYLLSKAAVLRAMKDYVERAREERRRCA